MEVLKQCIAEKVRVLDIPDDRRDRLQTGFLRRTESTLTHDELVSLGLTGLPAYDNRLEHTDLANAVNEFSELILVEDGPRLTRVRIDESDVDLSECRIRDRIDSRRFSNAVRLIIGVVDGRGIAGSIVARRDRNVYYISSRHSGVTRLACRFLSRGLCLRAGVRGGLVVAESPRGVDTRMVFTDVVVRCSEVNGAGLLDS